MTRRWAARPEQLMPAVSLLAVLAALIVGALMFIGVRRLIRSDGVQRTLTAATDRLIGAPAATDDLVGR